MCATTLLQRLRTPKKLHRGDVMKSGISCEDLFIPCKVLLLGETVELCRTRLCMNGVRFQMRNMKNHIRSLD